MEQLIIGLIIMAVTALFNNKDKQKSDKGTGPVAPQTEQQPVTQQRAQQQQRSRSQQAAQTVRNARDPAKRESARKRIEDYAKDLYKDLQAEMQQKIPQSQEEAIETVKQVAEKTPRPSREVTRKAKDAAGRIEQNSTIYANNIKRGEVRDMINSQNDLLPLNANDVQRGVIMAEILGQPKARKK